MVELTAVSGLRGKGPACFLVESTSARIMLDLGYGPQPGLWPEVEGIGVVDALLLSHGHRDHAGGLALLGKVGNPTIHASDIVCRMLPADLVSRNLPLRGQAEVCGVRVTTGRNGHAPGGIWIHLDVGGGLLYMGDYSTESIIYAHDSPPPARTLILDASYGDYDVALGDCHRQFDPYFEPGNVLLPVPEGGRGPEIALHLLRSGRGVPHIDEAIRSAVRRLVHTDHESLREGVAAELAELGINGAAITGPRGIVLASRADAVAGEAARLIELWEREPGPPILFTGYLPPGTPAQRLTQSGRAKFLRWNVHPRLSDNAALVRSVGAETVVPAFGDAKHLAAWREAFAPARVVIDSWLVLQ